MTHLQFRPWPSGSVTPTDQVDRLVQISPQKNNSLVTVRGRRLPAATIDEEWRVTDDVDGCNTHRTRSQCLFHRTTTSLSFVFIRRSWFTRWLSSLTTFGFLATPTIVAEWGGTTSIPLRLRSGQQARCQSGSRYARVAFFSFCSSVFLHGSPFRLYLLLRTGHSARQTKYHRLSRTCPHSRSL